MPMYNLIEYNDNYVKSSGSLWQYFRDESDDDLEILNHSSLKLR